MSDNPSLSPPQRSPAVTYKDRKKRKRTISHQLDSDSDSSVEDKQTPSPMKSSDSPKKAVFKVPSSKGPKKIDVSLPGPSPKRARCDSDESDMPKSKKAMHVRAASSVTSLKQVVKQVQESSNVSVKKPASSIGGSVRKSKSKAKSVAEDDDDNVSLADSSVSTSRVRRSEAERIQYFENQPECGKLEPHQVHCLRCNKPVNLGRKQTYTVRPWEIHRARCDQRPAFVPPATPGSNEAPVAPESPSVAASAPKTTPARRPSEQDRKEFLEGDKQIENVEKHRVRCRKCQNWIDLSQTNAYATGNWVKHKVRCSDAVPSNRVAAAKRRLVLVNDPQAKSFDAQKIGCSFCGVTVQLEGEGDFNLTKWDEHKSSCTKSVPVSKSESVNSIAFPNRSSRPPPSSASTEDTLVVDAGPSRPSQGLKRSREDSDAIPEEDKHKAIRPRTEAYVPPKHEPPSSILGWFMMPFHSFVQGFKESLS